MNKLYKGIIAMVAFYIFNMFIMQIIGNFIFIGDSFTISYHMFTYTGLMTLCGVIVVCTYIIVGKLNEVKDLLGKSDNQKDE
ncbi:hypothetical protein [Alkaliphilus sp. B6464]|uniref:hypothetical protein n=1 Tax=Alkaliphilus sp. B6464 TaxID=2731219 RepID=UPI001BAA75D6|nr:hypothetical protein [Alkaliphilus sp. B6464]QUH20357.1 hypothetical protein HYG84_10920 [Alkaliphilus sp. B6464]